MRVNGQVKGAFAGLAAVVLVVAGVWLAKGWGQHPVTGSSIPRAVTSSDTTQPCPDVKPTPATACWSPPAGYVTAPKTSTFSPVPDSTSDSSNNIPAGTISTQLAGGPFSSTEYITTDGWWNEANGVDYDVYAGAIAGDPSQGVVVVFSRPADDPTQTGNVSLTPFPTSGQDGSLQMISSLGWTITLQATDGVQYEFDVSTESYVQG